MDHALDVVMRLSYEQRQMLIDILSKRQTEERREEPPENARESVKSFHAGELKTESSDELTAKLIPAEQRVAGLHSGRIHISEDFDEPLPEEFWTGIP
ncbi:MAG: hypothetical protein BWK80_62615 [Desulfobacteraceae bacterium IS3]|nr:MAG: hypothetical protein BWK80_62615 [Desulfobacteraceae bacterium IS3]